MAKGSFTPTITLQRNNPRCYVGAGMSPQGTGKKKKKKINSNSRFMAFDLFEDLVSLRMFVSPIFWLYKLLATS